MYVYYHKTMNYKILKDSNTNSPIFLRWASKETSYFCRAITKIQRFKINLISIQQIYTVCPGKNKPNTDYGKHFQS